MSKPLVSLTVICYNAERFVREAIEGALAQTYSPLEIIFSDDASTDNTFEIIQEAVKDYKGPHKIVLNRNERNMGIGAHVSKVWFEIAKGEWIIVSAGDDVSLPHRISRIMQEASEDVALVHHHNILIDELSSELSQTNSYAHVQEYLETAAIEDIIKYGIWVRGMSMALNVKMLKLFGPFNPDIVNEDVVLAYRAKHFGRIIHLDESLMKYRIHSKSVSYTANKLTYAEYVQNLRRLALRRIAVMNQVITDTRVLKFSEKFIRWLQEEIVINKGILWLYGNEAFKVHYLLKRKLLPHICRRILYKPYLKVKDILQR